MRKIFPFLLGLTPFLLGWSLDKIMLLGILPPLFWLSFAMLALWFWFGRLACRGSGSPFPALLLLNLPAALVLILVLIQELIRGAYWFNPVGLLSQLFYLPMLNLSFTFTAWASRVWPAYVLSFLLMTGASLLGCRSLNRRR